MRADLLDGWVAKESITLLAPDGMANVIASSEPVSSSMDSYLYAETQGRLLREEFSGYDEESFGPKLIFGGRPGYIRVFQWIPDDGTSITQMQLYFAARGRGYTSTATTPTSEFSRFEQQLRDILATLTIEMAS